MGNSAIFMALPDLLLPWYAEKRRDLPWRQTRDPYRIWVSEIMLQQTRVEAVKGYYSRFLQTIPTVASLAEADDDLLHKLWEGLGYYSRVRNMKKAAMVIMNEHAGIFPKEYEKIRALPGIGPYTAGAIGSIAFNLPTPAVDGNVLRVVSRLTDDPTPIDLLTYKKQTEQALKSIYPMQAGDFTQALMELGATVCGPNREPDCKNCPCSGICRGYQNGTASTLPVKQPKRARKLEARTVFILSCNGKYALQKRPNKGLLAGLWQFPNVSDKLSVTAALEEVEKMGGKPAEILRQVEKKHIFTHIEWDMSGIYLEVKETFGAYRWMTAQEVEASAALPTAFRQFWEEIGYV